MHGSGPVVRQRPTADRLAECVPPPRPSLVPAIALIAGIVLADGVGAVPASLRLLVVLAPLLPAALLLFLARRHAASHRTVAVFLAAVALAVGFARQQSVLAVPPDHISHGLTDDPVLTRLSGRIVTPPIERPGEHRNPFIPFDPPPRTEFVVALEQLRTTDPPVPVVGKIRVSVEATGLGLRLGQGVRLTGKLYHPVGPQNPGAFDWVSWYRRQGLAAGLIVESAVHVTARPDRPAWWHRLVGWLRTAAGALLLEPQASYAAEDAGRLLEVLVLGQRGAADRALNEAFLRAGAMHFLSVSGFHVCVLASFAWGFVRRVLRGGRRAAAATMLVVTLAYAVIAEPNAPILRASVGVALVALAGWMRRPVCTLNWLAAAAIVLLLANPHELFRAGFQLSFVQVLALLTVVPAVWRRWIAPRSEDATLSEALTVWGVAGQKLGRWAAALAVVCLVAWVISLPLTAYHFGRFAPWGWLGSFVLTPLVAATIILSFVGIVAGLISVSLATGVAACIHPVTAALLWSVRLFEHLPRAVIEHSSPPLWLVAASYAGLLMWTARRVPTEAPPPQRRPVSVGTVVAVNALAVLLLAWMGWLVLPGSDRGDGHSLHVLAVGNGTATVWATPQGRAAIIDVGTDTNTDVGETMARALASLGLRRIDALVVSHSNYDHYSGLPTLAGRVPIQQWLNSSCFGRPRRAGDAAAEQSTRLDVPLPGPDLLQAGDRLTIDDSDFEVLWPPGDLGPAWSINDTSLVLRVTAAGRSILLPGDIERDAMAALLEADRAGRLSLKADVLIAPHHGAVVRDVTADFMAAVSPRFVIASTRTPRPKLVALAAEVLGPGARVVLTGEVGAVVVRIAPTGEVRLETLYATPDSP